MFDTRAPQGRAETLRIGFGSHCQQRYFPIVFFHLHTVVDSRRAIGSCSKFLHQFEITFYMIPEGPIWCQIDPDAEKENVKSFVWSLALGLLRCLLPI